MTTLSIRLPGEMVEYSSGAYITLNDPNATLGTFATGINNQGEVVGYYKDAVGWLFVCVFMGLLGMMRKRHP
jgi:hypothetical protein